MEEEYEADNDHMMTKLILPNGTVKEDFVVRTKTDVAREKNRILSEVQLRFPPAGELIMVILDEQGNEEVMKEDNKMDYYRNAITTGAIEIRDKSSNVQSKASGGRSSLESLGVSPR